MIDVHYIINFTNKSFLNKEITNGSNRYDANSKKYPGYFVALSYDRKKVLGKGTTPEQALKEAEQKGVKDPVITKIPHDNRSYLL